jgi:hypothetical protein
VCPCALLLSLSLADHNFNSLTYERNLSPLATTRITHLVLNYTGTSNIHNRLVFNTTSHITALTSAFTSITLLVPNLIFLAINFYSTAFPGIIISTECNKDAEFKGMRFLGHAISSIMETHSSFAFFSFWLDSDVKATIDFTGRSKRSIKKNLLRDLRRAFGKVLVDVDVELASSSAEKASGSSKHALRSV